MQFKPLGEEIWFPEYVMHFVYTIHYHGLYLSSNSSDIFRNCTLFEVAILFLFVLWSSFVNRLHVLRYFLNLAQWKLFKYVLWYIFAMVWASEGPPQKELGQLGVLVRCKRSSLICACRTDCTWCTTTYVIRAFQKR